MVELRIESCGEHSEGTKAMGKKVDIIWNLTRICPWDCAVCCVAAVQARKKGDFILLRSGDLTQTEVIKFDPNNGSIFDQAVAHRQQRGLELTFEEKLRVLDHLESFLPKIDISGGDPLSVSENMRVLTEASRRFGRQQITLTATGAGLAKCDPVAIAPYIGELNFTYDSPTTSGGESRPSNYAAGNLRKAAQFGLLGTRTRGECPLSAENVDEPTLRTIYLNLHEAQIDTLLLMRLFPVGRGVFRQELIPSRQQYERAIQVLRELEAKYRKPRVKLQCALKAIEHNVWTENPCDLVRESFGLMWDGTLLASPWAIGPHLPIADEWVLGNLATTPLKDILATEKAQEFERRRDENPGHCKIFAASYSPRARYMDRIFDAADPLYAPAEQEVIA